MLQQDIKKFEINGMRIKINTKKTRGRDSDSHISILSFTFIGYKLDLFPWDI